MGSRPSAQKRASLHLASLPRKRAAIVGLAKAGGPGVVLRTEPAIRVGHRRIAAAGLQMIDADVAGDAGAKRIFALDAAARWHGGVLRKQRLAYFAVLVGAAGAA